MVNVVSYLADGDTLQVSIPSTWQSKKAQSLSAASQTAQLRHSDQACQAHEHNTRGTQTDRLFKRYSDAVRGGPDFAPVVTFLARVTPLVEQAITENLTSSDTSQSLHLQADLPLDITLTHRLQGLDAALPETAQLCCTAVSWSPTGQGISVSYGRFDVEGWCSQSGYLCTWNLARNGLNPDKPDVRLETDSCLQCCCYHPLQPGLIAGGTFVGDVYVWDLAQDGDFQIFKSTLSASSHQEPVTAVAWHNSNTDALLQHGTEFDLVISLSSDGRLLLWQWESAQLLYGLELMHQHPVSRKMVLWGGSCMSLQQRDSRQLGAACMIGTEGGAVFRCSLETDPASLQTFAQEFAAGQNALNASAAKSFLYQHTGPVHAVHISPFDPNLIVTCGLDGQVRVVNCLTKQTMLELAPSDSYLFSARWSPTKAGLLAVGAGDGRVFFYCFGQDRQQPVKLLDVCGSSVPVYALAFNHKAPELFAAVDRQAVKVWTLASGFTQEQAADRHATHSMLAKTAEKLGFKTA